MAGKQRVGTRRGNGPAKGAGWGGPAKGASTSRIKAGPEGDAIRAMRWDPDKTVAREERIAALKAKLEDLAFNAEREETQLSAAVALLNREEGLPVARQISATVDSAEKVLRIEIVDEPSADPAPNGEAAASPSRLQH
jgi:hypothetical protein